MSDGVKIESKLELIYTKCVRNQSCKMMGEGSKTKNGYFGYHPGYPDPRYVGVTCTCAWVTMLVTRVLKVTLYETRNG